MNNILLKFGQIFMFIGCSLYVIFLLNISIDPQIGTSLHEIAVLMFIAGIILTWGHEKNSHIFLIVVGFYVWKIGVAYMIQCYRTISYDSCKFGGFLSMAGNLLMYFKNKPSIFYVTSYAFFGSIFIHYESTMSYSLVFLGSILMSIGSINYGVYLLEISTEPHIASLLLTMSVGMLIAGSILIYTYETSGILFSQMLGYSIFIIGLACELKSFFTPNSYALCGFGGLLVMWGIILRYLKYGKPEKYYKASHDILGLFFFFNGLLKFLMTIVRERPSWYLNIPGCLENAGIDVSIAFMQFLASLLMKFIAKKRIEYPQVEIDAFFCFNYIFG